MVVAIACPQDVMSLPSRPCVASAAHRAFSVGTEYPALRGFVGRMLFGSKFDVTIGLDGLLPIQEPSAPLATVPISLGRLKTVLQKSDHVPAQNRSKPLGSVASRGLLPT